MQIEAFRYSPPAGASPRHHATRCVRPGGPALGDTAIALLGDQVASAINAGVVGLVIDMGSIDALDSWAVAALVQLRRRVPPGLKLVLAALTPAAREVARVCLLHGTFDIYADAVTATQDLEDGR
jgi:anti-anti-sigma regulatory factor